MNLNIEIDEGSGFCYGVVRAIQTAETFLARDNGELYSLGAIVHNETELSRLEAIGLRTLDYDEFCASSDMHGKHLLIRAHGEPPRTYGTAAQAGYSVIDCTCPVVLKLQQRIRAAAERLGDKGLILIFGKKGHAEVNGLVGQVEQSGCRVAVIESPEMAIHSEIPQGCRTEIFSQTTKDPAEYESVCSILSAKCPSLVINRTICAQMASRHEKLKEFATRHSIIIFVAGKESSNGKVLYNLCMSNNCNCHFVGSPDEIKPGWFTPGDNVGICGATSTPKWLLEEVARRISEI